MSIIQKIYNFRHDSLFRNSFYLFLTTGVMAVFGFVFWLICARLFTPSEIGIATSLISSMTLISYISLLGFNSTFIRILPTSKNQNEVINAGIVLSMIAAIVLATVYVFAIPYIAPQLSIINQNIYYELGFIALVGLATINLLTDSIFVAFRKAKYNLLIDGFIMSGSKLFLPYLFVSLGAYGVFAASGAATSVAMVVSVLFLIWHFDFVPNLKIHFSTIRNFFHYLSLSYVANLFNIIPVIVMPIVVLNHLGSAAAGYYYLSFMVANLLYAIVYAVSTSLFAEGSYGRDDLGKLFKRSSLILTAIIVPATLFLVFAGPSILLFFGKSYGQEASQTIMIFALSSPVVAAYTLGNVILRIKNQIYANTVVNFVYAISISGLAILWVDRGLIWVAYAWMLGNALAAVTSFLSIMYGNFITTNKKEI